MERDGQRREKRWVGTSAVSHRQKHMNQDEKEKGSFFKFLRARAPEGPIFHRSRMRSLDRSLPRA